MMGALKLLVFWLVAITAFIWCFVSVAQLSGFLSSQARGMTLIRHCKLLEKQGLVQADVALRSLAWDCGLLALFILPHSLLTSHCWKNLMEDLGLSVIERAVYVMVTSFTLQTLMQYWYIIPRNPLWLMDLEGRWLIALFFWLLHGLCWLLIYASALTMDLPEMCGIKQVYYEHRGLPSPLDMKTVGTQRLYRHMRHPGAVCLLLVLWCHPVMTLDRLLLALTLTLYLLCGHRVTASDYIYVQQEMTSKQVRMHRRVVYEKVK